MTNYVCTQLDIDAFSGQQTCQAWSEYSSTVVTSSSDSAVEYSCLEFDSLGNCKSWQVEYDSSPLMPVFSMSEADKNEITVSIIGFFIVVWVFVQLKRFLQ